MIAKRLKELEHDGLICREVLNEPPIAVNSQATEFGRSAIGVLEQLRYWTENHDL